MEHIRFTAYEPGEDIEIAGIRYQPNNAERVYRILRPEGSGAATGWATLKPDPRNHYDAYAVELRAFGRKIGYVSARLARRYQDYTLEADRLNEAIELPHKAAWQKLSGWVQGLRQHISSRDTRVCSALSKHQAARFR